MGDRTEGTGVRRVAVQGVEPPERSAEHLPGSEPIAGSRRGVRQVLTRYINSVILLVIACAIAFAAIAVFPGDGPVAPDDAALQTVLVVGDFVPMVVSVQLTDQGAGRGTLVAVAVASRQRQSSHPRVLLEFPAVGQGPRICASCQRVGDLIDDVISTSDVGFVTVGPYRGYGQVAETLLSNVPYNLVSNRVYAAATVPDVRYIRSTSEQLYQAPGKLEPVPTTIAMHLARAIHYAWSGNPPPQVHGKDIVWGSLTPITGTATAASAVSLSGQDADTKATFIAGALIGIAGGALVGALQEAIAASRRRRE